MRGGRMQNTLPPTVASSATNTPPEQRWPEQLGTQRPNTERFPRRLFLAWLLPGILGLALLLAAVLLLEPRANRQIVYVQNDALRSIRADGTQDRPFAIDGFADSSFDVPQWARDGKTFATIARPSNELLLVPAANGKPQRIGLGVSGPVFIGKSWSYDNQYLTLLTERSGSPRLAVVAVGAGSVATADLIIDADAPVSWNPTRNERLVTAATVATSPTIQIVTPDGQVRAFVPNDKHAVRHGATWSPDGQQIAYVIPAANSRNTSSNRYGGAIWIANSDGGSPREVIAAGINMSPTWSEADNTLFFTRLVTETNAYELYRVQIDGQGLTKIGRSVPATLINAQNNPLVVWSPDRTKFFFQGINNEGSTTLYVAPADGTTSAVLHVSGAAVSIAAQWSPTSRAVLVADSINQTIDLVWTDTDRTDAFARGSFPSWQP